jgi:hypothetical protein
MAGLGGPRAGFGISMAEQRFPGCKDLMIMEPVSKVIVFSRSGGMRWKRQWLEF